MQLSIIIVNYNVCAFLEQCLASVRRAIQGLQAEVWVVDNASTDNSVAYLQPRFPEMHFLPLAENVGFARGNNAALPHCTGQYVLFLNPDTIVPEDALTQILAFMDTNPDAGALGIRMVDGSGQFLPESKRGFPTPAASLFKQLGLHRWFPQSARLAHYYAGHLPAHQTHAVEVLAGAFMLVRATVLQAVGSFDEAFFMYGEDIDLSYRITQAGWKNYYFADSTIIHFKGESTAKGSLNYVRVFYQAMLLFVRKHYQGRGAWWYRLLLYAGIGTRAGISAMRRLLQPRSPAAAWPQQLAMQPVGWPASLPPIAWAGQQTCTLLWQQHSPNLPLAICAGQDLPVKKAIDLLEKQGPHRPCWIHLHGTSHLVGSHDKNLAGHALQIVDEQPPAQPAQCK